jgi:OOP family OmpA-OmpF porin
MLVRSLFVASISLGLLYGCSGNPAYSPSPYDPVQLDPAAYVPKVDSFVVILDASASMGHRYQGRSKYNDAMDSVNRINQTIPPLDYQAGLAAFSSGTCLDGASTQLLYGMTTYEGSAFDSALNSVNCAGGTSPLAGAVDVSTQSLGATSGDTAVIIVSDFHKIDSSMTSAAINRMQAASGNRLCVHTISIGNNDWDQKIAEGISNNSDCGSAVTAGDIASPDKMAEYVTAVLLAPAPPPAATVVKYEKNTMSTAALFDFDKAVLKEEGKVALHELGDAIKAKGAKVVDIDIIGHTDSTGPAEYNMGLSVRRAEAVRDYIVSEGIDANIIDVSGEGENNPIASNDTAEGRAENRRVDINVGVEQATNQGN